MESRKLTRDELLEISASLEDYHKIFYQFWSMSSVTFTDEIPTAAVSFANSKPDMMINPDFWDSLNKKGKLFVVCHECLHVILDHGSRNGRDKFPKASSEQINVAQDIPINEMIVHFGFDRVDLEGWDRYCWIDTCFPDRHPKKNETFLYYLEELLKNKSEKMPAVFDIHLGSGPEKTDEKKNKEDVAYELIGELSDDELQDFLEALGTGADSFSGKIEARLEKMKKVKKIDFRHIIRRIKKTSIKEKEFPKESFASEDRRFNDVISRHGVVLPGSTEVPKPLKDRLLTAIFMDVSYSCISYVKTFNSIIVAFDHEKKIFDSRLFIFDTRVTEVKPGDRISVGGGTAFNIIERKCLELEAEVGRYPDCVIIVTDGEGNEVSPKAPTKWIWLLTDHSTKRFIHPQSRHLMIKDVTFE
jgi:predicted metal-dependent peptidase